MPSDVLGRAVNHFGAYQLLYTRGVLAQTRAIGVKFIILPAWALLALYLAWLFCLSVVTVQLYGHTELARLEHALVYVIMLAIYYWVFSLYFIATAPGRQHRVVLGVAVLSMIIPASLLILQAVSWYSADARVIELPISRRSVQDAARAGTAWLLTIWTLWGICVQWMVARNLSTQASDGRRALHEVFWVFLMLLYYPIAVYYIRRRVLRVLNEI